VPVLPVLPVSPPGSVGESVGLPVSVGVGVGVGVGVAVVGVGVGDVVGDGDVAPSLGVDDVVGEPPDVVGVGVTDGLGVAHDGVGDPDGDGDVVGTRFRSSSSVFSWPAEAALLGLAVVVGAAVVTGAGEAAAVLVKAVVTGDGQLEEADGRGDAPPLDEVAPAPRAVLCAPADVAPEPGPPVPLPACEPLPSVPAPPEGCDGLKTVLLAWMIAWRKGCTLNETLAMIAIPASTITGRSQPTLSREALRPDRAEPSPSSSPGRGRRRSRGSDNRGNDNRGSDNDDNDNDDNDRCGNDNRGSARPAAVGSAVGHAQLQCHDQCPRQTQFLAASRAPAPTVSHHGRGGRPPILARIRSSPSAPGSTPPTASARPRRSDSSMPSSGVVMPSPARLRRPRHDDSWDSIVLSDAIARAVWLFTAPLLIPIALAMSASEKSA
jgi:hypothetical protein